MRLILNTLSVFFCFGLTALLVLFHLKRTNYNNAFKNALKAVPEIETVAPDKMMVTQNLSNQLSKFIGEESSGQVEYDVIQYFRHHGSSPSGFLLLQNKLHFDRKLPNAKYANHFELIQEDGAWKIDSIGNLAEVFEKIKFLSVDQKCLDFNDYDD